jgi:hypothetical protein
MNSKYVVIIALSVCSIVASSFIVLLSLLMLYTRWASGISEYIFDIALGLGLFMIAINALNVAINVYLLLKGKKS